MKTTTTPSGNTTIIDFKSKHELINELKMIIATYDLHDRLAIIDNENHSQLIVSRDIKSDVMVMIDLTDKPTTIIHRESGGWAFLYKNIQLNCIKGVHQLCLTIN